MTRQERWTVVQPPTSSEVERSIFRSLSTGSHRLALVAVHKTLGERPVDIVLDGDPKLAETGGMVAQGYTLDGDMEPKLTQYELTAHANGSEPATIIITRPSE